MDRRGRFGVGSRAALSGKLRGNKVKHNTCLVMLVMCSSLGACVGTPGAPPEYAKADARPQGRQLVQIADALVEHGDRVRAAQYLGWAQKDGVPAHEVVPRLISLYAEDGQYRLAIDTAERYLRQRPSDARIRKCLGALYLAIDELDAARSHFETLVRETPDDPDARYALASTLRASGSQLARADEQYRAYLALAPDGRHAEEARASLLTKLP